MSNRRNSCWRAIDNQFDSSNPPPPGVADDFLTPPLPFSPPPRPPPLPPNSPPLLRTSSPTFSASKTFMPISTCSEHAKKSGIGTTTTTTATSTSPTNSKWCFYNGVIYDYPLANPPASIYQFSNYWYHQTPIVYQPAYVSVSRNIQMDQRVKAQSPCSRRPRRYYRDYSKKTTEYYRSFRHRLRSSSADREKDDKYQTTAAKGKSKHSYYSTTDRNKSSESMPSKKPSDKSKEEMELPTSSRTSEAKKCSTSKRDLRESSISSKSSSGSSENNSHIKLITSSNNTEKISSISSKYEKSSDTCNQKSRGENKCSTETEREIAAKFQTKLPFSNKKIKFYLNSSYSSEKSKDLDSKDPVRESKTSTKSNPEKSSASLSEKSHGLKAMENKIPIEIKKTPNPNSNKTVTKPKEIKIHEECKPKPTTMLLEKLKAIQMEASKSHSHKEESKLLLTKTDNVLHEKSNNPQASVLPESTIEDKWTRAFGSNSSRVTSSSKKTETEKKMISQTNQKAQSQTLTTNDTENKKMLLQTNQKAHSQILTTNVKEDKKKNLSPAIKCQFKDENLKIILKRVPEVWNIDTKKKEIQFKNSCPSRSILKPKPEIIDEDSEDVVPISGSGFKRYRILSSDSEIEDDPTTWKDLKVFNSQAQKRCRSRIIRRRPKTLSETSSDSSPERKKATYPTHKLSQRIIETVSLSEISSSSDTGSESLPPNSALDDKQLQIINATANNSSPLSNTIQTETPISSKNHVKKLENPIVLNSIKTKEANTNYEPEEGEIIDDEDVSDLWNNVVFDNKLINEQPAVDNTMGPENKSTSNLTISKLEIGQCEHVNLINNVEKQQNIASFKTLVNKNQPNSSSLFDALQSNSDDASNVSWKMSGMETSSKKAALIQYTRCKNNEKEVEEIRCDTNEDMDVDVETVIIDENPLKNNTEEDLPQIIQVITLDNSSGEQTCSNVSQEVVIDEEGRTIMQIMEETIMDNAMILHLEDQLMEDNKSEIFNEFLDFINEKHNEEKKKKDETTQTVNPPFCRKVISDLVASEKSQDMVTEFLPENQDLTLLTSERFQALPQVVMQNTSGSVSHAIAQKIPETINLVNAQEMPNLTHLVPVQKEFNSTHSGIVQEKFNSSPKLTHHLEVLEVTPVVISQKLPQVNAKETNKIVIQEPPQVVVQKTPDMIVHKTVHLTKQKKSQVIRHKESQVIGQKESQVIGQKESQVIGQKESQVIRQKVSHLIGQKESQVIGQKESQVIGQNRSQVIGQKKSQEIGQNRSQVIVIPQVTAQETSQMTPQETSKVAVRETSQVLAKKTSQGTAQETSKVTAQKISKENAQETSKEAAQETSKEAAQETSKMTAQKTYKVTVQETSQLSAKEIPQTTVQETSKVPAKQTPQLIAEKISHVPAKQTPQVTTEKTSQVPAKQTPQMTTKETPQVTPKETPQVMAEKTPQVIAEKIPQVKTEKTPQVTAQKEPKVVAQETSQVVAQETFQVVTQKAPQVIVQKTPQVVAQETSQVTTEKTSQVTTEKTSQVTTEKTSQVTTEKTSQVTTEKTSQVTSKETPQVTSQKVLKVVVQETSQVVAQKTYPVVTQKPLQVIVQKTPQVLAQKTPQVLAQKTSQVPSIRKPQVIAHESLQITPEKALQVITEKASQVTPEKALQVMAPKTYQEIIAQEPNQEIIAQKPNQEIIAQELNQKIIAQEPNQEIIAQELNQKIIAQTTFQKIPQIIAQKTPQIYAQKMPQIIAQKTPQIIAQKTSQVIAQKTSKVIFEEPNQTIIQEFPQVIKSPEIPPRLPIIPLQTNLQEKCLISSSKLAALPFQKSNQQFTATLIQHTNPMSNQQCFPTPIQHMVPVSTQQSIPVSTQQIPVSTQQSIPVSTQKSIPVSTQQSFPVSTQQSIPQSIPVSTQQSIPLSTQQSIPVSTQQLIPVSMQPFIPAPIQHMTPVITQHMTPVITQHKTPVLTQHTSPAPIQYTIPVSNQSIPASLEQSLPVSMEQSIPVSMEQSIPVSMEQSIPVSMEQSIPVSIEQSIPVSMEQFIPMLIEQPIPVSTQQPIPMSIQSIPVSTPQSIPVSNPQSIPVSTQQLIPVSTQQLIRVCTAQSIPMSTQQLIPVSTQQLIPVSTQQMIPVSTQQSIPVSTEQMIPVSTQQMIPVSAQQMIPVSSQQSIPLSAQPKISKTPQKLDSVMLHNSLQEAPIGKIQNNSQNILLLLTPDTYKEKNLKTTQEMPLVNIKSVQKNIDIKPTQMHHQLPPQVLAPTKTHSPTQLRVQLPPKVRLQLQSQINLQSLPQMRQPAAFSLKSQLLSQETNKDAIQTLIQKNSQATFQNRSYSIKTPIKSYLPSEIMALYGDSKVFINEAGVITPNVTLSNTTSEENTQLPSSSTKQFLPENSDSNRPTLRSITRAAKRRGAPINNLLEVQFDNPHPLEYKLRHKKYKQRIEEKHLSIVNDSTNNDGTSEKQLISQSPEELTIQRTEQLAALEQKSKKKVEKLVTTSNEFLLSNPITEIKGSNENKLQSYQIKEQEIIGSNENIFHKVTNSTAMINNKTKQQIQIATKSVNTENNNNMNTTGVNNIPLQIPAKTSINFNSIEMVTISAEAKASTRIATTSTTADINNSVFAVNSPMEIAGNKTLKQLLTNTTTTVNNNITSVQNENPLANKNNESFNQRLFNDSQPQIISVDKNETSGNGHSNDSNTIIQQTFSEQKTKEGSSTNVKPVQLPILPIDIVSTLKKIENRIEETKNTEHCDSDQEVLILKVCMANKNEQTQMDTNQNKQILESNISHLRPFVTQASQRYVATITSSSKSVHEALSNSITSHASNLMLLPISPSQAKITSTLKPQSTNINTTTCSYNLANVIAASSASNRTSTQLPIYSAPAPMISTGTPHAHILTQRVSTESDMILNKIKEVQNSMVLKSQIIPTSSPCTSSCQISPKVVTLITRSPPTSVTTSLSTPVYTVASYMVPQTTVRNTTNAPNTTTIKVTPSIYTTTTSTAPKTKKRLQSEASQMQAMKSMHTQISNQTSKTSNGRVGEHLQSKQQMPTLMNVQSTPVVSAAASQLHCQTTQIPPKPPQLLKVANPAPSNPLPWPQKFNDNPRAILNFLETNRQRMYVPTHQNLIPAHTTVNNQNKPAINSGTLSVPLKPGDFTKSTSIVPPVAHSTNKSILTKDAVSVEPNIVEKGNQNNYQNKQPENITLQYSPLYLTCQQASGANSGILCQLLKYNTDPNKSINQNTSAEKISAEGIKNFAQQQLINKINVGLNRPLFHMPASKKMVNPNDPSSIPMINPAWQSMREYEKYFDIEHLNLYRRKQESMKLNQQRLQLVQQSIGSLSPNTLINSNNSPFGINTSREKMLVDASNYKPSFRPIKVTTAKEVQVQNNSAGACAHPLSAPTFSMIDEQNAIARSWNEFEQHYQKILHQQFAEYQSRMEKVSIDDRSKSYSNCTVQPKAPSMIERQEFQNCVKETGATKKSSFNHPDLINRPAYRGMCGENTCCNSPNNNSIPQTQLTSNLTSNATSRMIPLQSSSPIGDRCLQDPKSIFVINGSKKCSEAGDNRSFQSSTAASTANAMSSRTQQQLPLRLPPNLDPEQIRRYNVVNMNHKDNEAKKINTLSNEMEDQSLQAHNLNYPTFDNHGLHSPSSYHMPLNVPNNLSQKGNVLMPVPFRPIPVMQNNYDLPPLLPSNAMDQWAVNKNHDVMMKEMPPARVIENPNEHCPYEHMPPPYLSVPLNSALMYPHLWNRYN